MIQVTKTQKRSIILTLLLIALSLTLSSSSPIKSADFAIFDWQSKQLSPQLNADKDIIVIAIDDYSLQQMTPIAGRWVWPRTVHGQIIESLKQQSVKAIAFDILFAEQDIYRPDADSYFNEIIAETDNIFLATLEQKTTNNGGMLLSQYPKELGLVKTPLANEHAKSSFLLPTAINQKNWQLGTINFESDFDGIGRHYDVYRELSGWQLPSLPSKIVTFLKLPITNQQKIILQWHGHTEQPYNTVSFYDVYQAVSQNNTVFLAQFIDKIILIGTTASGLYDARATPINKQLPGVYMLATAIDNLKNQNYLSPISDSIQAIVTILIIIMIASCFIINSSYQKMMITAVAIMIIASIILIVSSYFLLQQQKLFWLGSVFSFMVVSFILFSLIYGYLEYKHRQQTLSLFSRFLDPHVVNKLLKEDALSPEQLNKKQILTVLFSDIRGFTELAEKSEVEQVVKLLNQYLNRQVNIIFEHRGTLDKFIGDCIMAFWGAPVSQKDHAIYAINAALAMEQALISFQKKLPKSWQDFDIGIGIHTGECIVGMIGTDLRVDYTVIGDSVNLASRIEGLTKNTARILVSEQTKLLADDAFDYIFQGEFHVKGRVSSVRVYQPKRK